MPNEGNGTRMVDDFIFQPIFQYMGDAAPAMIKPKTMKNYLGILFLFLTLPLCAQDFRTGDAGLDAELKGINLDARNDLSGFKSGVTAEFSISVPKLDGLLKFLQPAEVVLALRIADVVNVSVDRVTESYKVNKDKGWGYIAKEMGIKPGSPEFHALKGKDKKSNPGGGNKGNGQGNGQGNGKK